MKKLILNRIHDNGVITKGELIVYDHRGNRKLTVCTLEPSWKNNHRLVSCIPLGEYRLVPRISEKFGKHYYIKNVEGRELILIHVGNARKDTQGCVLVGEYFGNWNDEERVIDSRTAMNKLLLHLGTEEHTLIIK